MAADQFNRLNAAVLSDAKRQNHVSRNVRLSCQKWIDGIVQLGQEWPSMRGRNGLSTNFDRQNGNKEEQQRQRRTIPAHTRQFRSNPRHPQQMGCCNISNNAGAVNPFFFALRQNLTSSAISAGLIFVVNRARRRRGWGNVGIPRLLRDFQAQWEPWKSRGWTFPRFPLRAIFPAKLWILVIFEMPRQMQIFPNCRGEPFFGTPLHALREERPFALVESFCFANHRLARNPFQVRSRSDPCVSSTHNSGS